MVTESIEHAVLANESSQPKSTYETNAKFRSADGGFVASVVGGGVSVDCCGGGLKDGNDYGMIVEYTGEESVIT
ncbi:hypothetical protein Tco_0427172 [Tanacetum coccineum]